MRWIGVDLHKCFAHVTEIADGGRKMQYRVELTAEGIAEFKGRLGADAHVVFEASRSSFRFYDEVVQQAGSVVVAHPAQTRGASAYHVKTDEKESEVLARLLQSNFVRSVWVPTGAQRSLRSLVENRDVIVRMRVATMNRLHSLLEQELIAFPAKNLFSRRGRHLAESIPWTREEHHLIARSLLKTYDFLQEEIAGFGAHLRSLVEESWDGRLLLTIPGVSFVIAAVILSEIGSVKRFASPRQLCAYAGLVPRVFKSGKVSFTSHISLSGRRLLRWAVCLAVRHVVCRPGPMRDFHEALSSRRPKGIVRVACARKLLTIIWHMLMRGRPYRH